ncbi:hypothetical protein HDU77_011271 [Chytriomyces hyalinus]|nr:hypothetical protein HDU77_011271 [Chytriomyces hyalinus]
MFKFGRNNAGSSGNIANGPPTGEIATAILDVATNPAAPEVEWGAVFSTMERIKAFYSTNTPGEGCSQALKAIRYRLSSEDPVAINYILQVMDAFYKNCEQQFTSQVASKDFLNFLKSVLERPSLAAENRGQLLELIADWGTANPPQPEMRKFFESCVKDGYKFSESALAKLPPATLQALRSNSNKGGIFYGAINSWSTTGVPQQNYMVTQVPAQQFMRPQAPVQPKINEVPYSERVNWIKFDVDVADNCVSMLLETVNFADQSSDVGKNEIAKETFMRCCDIQRRIVSSISKVDEPDLVEKLLSTNRKINDALEQFNNRRLAFSKRFAGADPLIDFGELRESLPPAAPAGPPPSGPATGTPAATGYQIGSGASSSRPAAEDPFSDQAAAGAAGPSNHRI